MATRINYTATEFYDLFKSKINEFTSNKPTYWGSGSVAGAFAKAVSYFAELLQLQINLAYLAFRIKTATGSHLIRRLSDFGITPYSPTFAMSTQTFTGDVGRTGDILIPAGTQVKTQTVNGDTKFYTLVYSITLSQTASSVNGYCICTVSGTYGNTGAGTINELVSPITGIASTTNAEAVANGSNAESDDQLKSRFAKFLLGLKKGNEDAILSAVYGIEGVTLVKILENVPTNGNFSVYVTTATGVVDSILLNKIRNVLDSVKGVTTTYSIIVPIVSNITVSFDLSFDANNYLQEDVIQIVKVKLKNFINLSRVSTVYIADIINQVKDINGIINIKNVKINGIASDLILNDSYVAKINLDSDISITVV